MNRHLYHNLLDCGTWVVYAAILWRTVRKLTVYGTKTPRIMNHPHLIYFFHNSTSERICQILILDEVDELPKNNEGRDQEVTPTKTSAF